MGLSTLIPAIIFGLVGVFIIVYTIKLFLSAIIGNPWNWLEQQKILKKERLLNEGDSFFQNEDNEKAISSWKGAFYLDRINSQVSNIDKSHNLNINLLGRLLSLSENKSAHIINLPVLEELFAERSELLHLHFETSATLKKLRLKKKGSTSKKSPDWALQEFSKKHAEVKQQINENRDSLEAELKKLFDSLTQLSAAQDITYH